MGSVKYRFHCINMLVFPQTVEMVIHDVHINESSVFE